jgi:DNA polymerase
MMDQGGNPGLQEQVAASLDWWRDAGVDAVFHDEPINWIAPKEAPAGTEKIQASEPRPRRTQAAVAEPPKPAFIELPPNLADFNAWWLAEPALDGGRIAGRVPPRGQAGARLMILVPEPELEDDETLLSGPQGRLLDAMVTAMGISPQEAYVASVLPRHTPHADWETVAARGIGRVAAHHVALVSPQELIVFGQTIPSLLGNDPPNNSAILQSLNHEGASVPCLSDRSLGAMLERPRWKAGFWQRWLGRSIG